MAQWLHDTQDGALLMCHPANASVPGDAIASARTTEYAYLASPAFAELLQRLGVQLATGPQAAPTDSLLK